MKGTTFGSIHSYTDLNLIQQSIEISPAVPRTSYIDIPGGDGSKDLTEAHGVGVKYQDRIIKWTFGLYPGDNWLEKQQLVSGAINGLSCHIVLDDDPNYYYEGRIEVKDYKVDGLLKQITVEAVCRPWKLKIEETTVTRGDLTSNYKQLILANGRKPIVPTIVVTENTTLLWNSATYDLSAGSHIVPNIYLSKGDNLIKAKLDTAATGSITITYRQGEL